MQGVIVPTLTGTKGGSVTDAQLSDGLSVVIDKAAIGGRLAAWRDHALDAGDQAMALEIIADVLADALRDVPHVKEADLSEILPEQLLGLVVELTARSVQLPYPDADLDYSAAVMSRLAARFWPA